MRSALVRNLTFNGTVYIHQTHLLGGVFNAVHKSLTSHEVSYSGTHSMVACRLKLSSKVSLLACCVYRLLNHSTDKFTDLCTTSERFIPSNPNDATWLADDFDLPDINWNNYFISSNSYPLRTQNI